MDLADFRARLEAARAFEAEVEGAKFRLRLPTEHAFRTTLEAHRDSAGRLLEAEAFRAVLDTALVGWDGVKTTHIDAEAAEAPLPFSADTRALLLDHRQDIADQLSTACWVRRVDRRAKREEALKN